MTVTLKSWEVSGKYIDCMLETEMKNRREWIAEWFGPRCEVFEPSCIVCRLWKNQDQFERAARGS